MATRATADFQGLIQLFVEHNNDLCNPAEVG